MQNTKTIIVAAASVKNLGVKNKLDDKWYNYKGKDKAAYEEVFRGLVKDSEMNVILVPGDEYGFSDVASISLPTGEAKTVTTDKPVASKGHVNFLDDYVSFEELLEKAKIESNGTYVVETKMLHYDHDKQVAVFQAQVRGEWGADKIPRWATAHGDCDQHNGGMVKMHYVRMAETRAIARALRVVLGIGKTAEVEVE